MHPTAMDHAKLFFDTYAQASGSLTIIDLGAQDFNGSLRSVAPADCNYIGVDFMAGKGVDVIITDSAHLPFDTDSIDICVSSSCFEHAEFFWLSFLEIMRVLKPGGLFYLNAPSNAMFHRYPVDCWRFYPDSASALSAWGCKEGFDTVLLETFTGRQDRGMWNDLIAIYLKGSEFIDIYPERMLEKSIGYTNGLVLGETELRNPTAFPEDMAARLRLEELLALNADEAQSARTKAELESKLADAQARQAVLENELVDMLAHQAALETANVSLRKDLTWAEARLCAVEASKAHRMLKVVERVKLFLVSENRGVKDQITTSGLFDAGWYLQQNADVRAKGLDPLKHYLRFGAGEGRDPSPLFSTKNYLAANPDAGINPLVHYLRYGKADRRGQKL